jgi:hypothetical protein
LAAFSSLRSISYTDDLDGSEASGTVSFSLEIRNWLKANGYQVSDRGRISVEFMKAWETKTPATSGAVGNDQPENDGSTNGHAVQFQPA